MSDLISRKAILKHIEKIRQGVQMMDDTHRVNIVMTGMHLCEDAVRNQPFAQSEPCEDAVSRADVIKEISESVCDLEYNCDNRALCEVIKALPPVTPKLPECEDAVSRKDVLDGAVTHYNVSDANIAYRDPVPVEYIESLPSVISKRKPGKWIDISNKWGRKWECDQCGYIVDLEDGGIYDFCGACGADMRGEQDG